MATKKKKRAKKYAAVVALAGGGKSTKKQAKTHLSDFIESVDGEILWVIPQGDDVAKPYAMVADFLWEEEARYILVTDEDFEDEDWTKNAERVVEADDDIYTAALTEAAEVEADEKILVILLDEDHEGDVELVESAMDAGMKCLDLSSGLIELEEVVEEDDDDEEDEPDEELDEEEPVIEIPAKIQKLIDAGKAEEAGIAFSEKFSSDEVRALADDLGVPYKKGVWAKTIGKDIAEKLHGGDEETEEAKVEVVEGEVAEEPLTGEGEPEERLTQSVDQDMAMANPYVSPSDVIHAAAHVAGQKGAVEAGKFLDLLKKQGLI